MATARQIEPATSAHLRAELRRVEAELQAARAVATEAQARAQRAELSCRQAWEYSQLLLRTSRRAT